MRPHLSARAWAEAMDAFCRTGQLPETPIVTGPRPAADRGIPIALLGGPVRRDALGLFDLIEEAGGQIRLDATATGDRTMPDEFAETALATDPLSELVRAYFEVIPDVFRRPNRGLYEWLERQIAARKIRGVICRSYVWCDLWRAELHRFKEQLSVPVLGLDVNDEDETTARLSTRVQAFLEMLR